MFSSCPSVQQHMFLHRHQVYILVWSMFRAQLQPSRCFFRDLLGTTLSLQTHRFWFWPGSAVEHSRRRERHRPPDWGWCPNTWSRRSGTSPYSSSLHSTETANTTVSDYSSSPPTTFSLVKSFELVSVNRKHFCSFCQRCLNLTITSVNWLFIRRQQSRHKHAHSQNISTTVKVFHIFHIFSLWKYTV